MGLAKTLRGAGNPQFGFTGAVETIKSTALTIAATTATAIPATPLAERQSLIIYNNDSATLYIGGSGVTNSSAATGIPLAAGANLPINAGPEAVVYGYSAAGTSSFAVIVMEIA